MSAPLILLSGLLSDESVWCHQAIDLNNISPIQIIDFKTENTPKKMLEKILDLAPEQFNLAGHSMGGWLALEVMKIAPKRVQKLCLINTTARIDSPEKLQRRLQMIEDVKNGLFHRVATDIADKFVFNQDIKPLVLDMFLRVGQDAFINQQQAMLMRDECFSALEKIHCPTLIIHASHDQNFNLEMHQEMAKPLHTDVKIVKNAGHMSIMEAPNDITDLMKPWLIKK